MKILIVEDERKVASFIKKGLEENNYEAEVAYDGLSAEKLAQLNKYDLFILDIIIGFDAGANDYLVKPFEFRELLARVKVLLKKPGQPNERANSLIVGDV